MSGLCLRLIVVGVGCLVGLGLFPKTSRAAELPSCADPSAKRQISAAIENQLIASGIPDIAFAINDKRIVVKMDRIAETGRNSESKFVQCAANITVSFDESDLQKARKLMSEIPVKPYEVPRNTTETGKVQYTLYVPVDKNDDPSPLVEINSRSLKTMGLNIERHTASYSLFSTSVKDVQGDSSNDIPWSVEYKRQTISECADRPNKSEKYCSCLIDGVEKMLSEENFQRVMFTLKILPPTSRPFPVYQERLSKLIGACEGNATASMSSPSKAVATSSQPPAEVASRVSTAPPTTASSRPEIIEPKTVSPAAPTPDPVKPSFDCAKASNAVERMICTDRGLAALDVELSRTFKAAMMKASNDNMLRNEQIGWLKVNRNACDQRLCVESAYRLRIDELKKRFSLN